MDTIKSIEVLESLAAGCLPETGEIADAQTLFDNPDVIQALQLAIVQLRKTVPGKSAQQKPKKENPYSEIDFFRKGLFNTMPADKLKALKKKAATLGITKSNLPPYQAKARSVYPRAYEPWLKEERELLTEAIKFTNDLELLSEIFQRGKGSIQIFGQKVIFESQMSNDER